MSVLDFETNAGKVMKDGKPYWPDMISINIPKDRILSIVTNMLSQLENGLENINIVIVGEIQEREED